MMFGGLVVSLMTGVMLFWFLSQRKEISLAAITGEVSLFWMLLDCGQGAAGKATEDS